MMKYLLCLTTFALLSFSGYKYAPIDRIGVKGPLQFNKEDYFFAVSQKPNVNYYIQQYLPREETIKAFNQLLTVSVLVTTYSVETIVLQKTAELENRKATDKVSNYSVSTLNNGTEHVVDCVTTTENSEGEVRIADFTIYRYKAIELDNHTKAVLIYAYSKRSYGREVLPFFTTLAKDRKNLLAAMSLKELPAIKIRE
jgi:D-hexose-6-phosphate mutarotase